MIKTKKPRNLAKKIITSILAISLLSILFLIIYELVLDKPTEVNSGILQHEKIFTEHTSQLWTVRFSPGDSLIASAGVDSTVKIWRREDAGIIRSLKQPMGITSLEFSPDGKFIVTGSYDEKVRIWDWEANRIVKEFNDHKGTIWSVVFSPDGKMIASSGEDKIIRLWDVQTGTLVKAIPAHRLNIWKVRFTPDGSKIVSSSFDNTIKIWSVSDGALLKTLEGHTEAVVGLAISKDGKLLASGSDDKTIKLWDLKSGQLIRSLSGSEHVYSVAFSPDGKRLVSGSRDKGNIGEIFQNFFGDSDKNKGVTICLWDVETGKLQQTLSQHANDVMEVTYSSDGKWIASASTDKTVRLWRITK